MTPANESYMDTRTVDRWTTIPSDLPLLLTVNEAASITGVTGKHIRYLLSENLLKGCKLGGTWRVNRDALLTMAGLV